MLPSLEEDIGPCLIWAGKLDRKGYPLYNVKVDGKWKYRKAHRRALEVRLGRPIRPGYCALHKCDTPACVNGDHLWEGTKYDNNQDMFRKGRYSKGEGRWNSKLTPDDIREIRWMVRHGCRQYEAAAVFGVTPSNVSYIVNKTWQHVA